MASNYSAIQAYSSNSESISVSVAWEINNPDTDLLVYVSDTEGNVSLSEDYSFNESDSTLNFANTLGYDGYYIFIFRAEEASMYTQLVPNGDFSVVDILSQLSKNVRVLEQLQENEKSCIRASGYMAILPSSTIRAGKVLSFDDDGNPITVVAQESVENIEKYHSETLASATKASDSAASASASASTAEDCLEQVEQIKDDTEALVDGIDAKLEEAEASADSAETSATSASASATSATTSATNASTSASTASAKATAASTSATNAATSATSASNSATSAASSAASLEEIKDEILTGTGLNYLTSAQEQAEIATTQAELASTQATNAAASATSASTSASTATTKATSASSSATTATTQATSASTSASTATTKASEASASATSASASATSAAASATSASESAATAQANASAFSSSLQALSKITQKKGELYFPNYTRAYTGSISLDTSSPFTVCARVKRDSSGVSQVFFTSGNGTSPTAGFYIYIWSNYSLVQIGLRMAYNSALYRHYSADVYNKLNDGNFHNIAIIFRGSVYDESTSKYSLDSSLYIDGELMTESSISSSTTDMSTETSTYLFFNATTSAYFNDSTSNANSGIADFKIFNFGLPANEEADADSVGYTVEDYNNGLDVPPLLQYESAEKRCIYALENYTYVVGSTRYVPASIGSRILCVTGSSATNSPKGTHDNSISTLSDLIISNS